MWTPFEKLCLAQGEKAKRNDWFAPFDPIRACVDDEFLIVDSHLLSLNPIYI